MVFGLSLVVGVAAVVGATVVSFSSFLLAQGRRHFKAPEGHQPDNRRRTAKRELGSGKTQKQLTAVQASRDCEARKRGKIPAACAPCLCRWGDEANAKVSVPSIVVVLLSFALALGQLAYV